MTLLDRVAGAPISWGVCEVPGWGHQLPADTVLTGMRRLGLAATELGPDGFDLALHPGEAPEQPADEAPEPRPSFVTELETQLRRSTAPLPVHSRCTQCGNRACNCRIGSVRVSNRNKAANAA